MLEGMKTDAVLVEVLQERKRQEEKWGQQNHPPIEYCAILGEEVGEVNKAALEAHFGYKWKGRKDGYTVIHQPKTVGAKLAHWRDLREELIQTAAVAVAMVESLDRNQLCTTEEHEGLPDDFAEEICPKCSGMGETFDDADYAEPHKDCDECYGSGTA